MLLHTLSKPCSTCVRWNVDGVEALTLNGFSLNKCKCKTTDKLKLQQSVSNRNENVSITQDNVHLYTYNLVK